MQPTTLPEDVRATFETFERVGGVVDYFVFELDDDLDPHRTATLAECGGSFGGPLNDGSLSAFADPPYSSSAKPTEVQEFYAAINAALFGDFHDDLEIRRYTSDWSDFFDAGLEWWGAYWWTVLNRTRGIIAVVVASSTG